MSEAAPPESSGSQSVGQGSVSPGLVCTFYSFKGGVGRSMALANVAALLARWGSRVLTLDWDLEAPGLEKYFAPPGERGPRRGAGVVDLVSAFAEDAELDWRRGLLRVPVRGGREIDVLHAGRDDGQYQDRLRAIRWPALFDRGLGARLEELRDEWRAEYDYVLVDSRTGYTDAGGICTILLPDIVVSLFTTNEQSLHGVADAMRGARAAHARLPLDRGRLLFIPVPARDESLTEYVRAKEWRARFAQRLAPFYEDWIPRAQTAEQVLDYLKIPHVPFWSFGERLPALEEDADNPKTLAYSYAVLARLIRGRGDWTQARQGGREAAEAEARAAEEAGRRLEQTAVVRRQADEAERVQEARRLAELRAVVMARYETLCARERGTESASSRRAGRWRIAAGLLALGVPACLVLAALDPNVDQWAALLGGAVAFITAAGAVVPVLSAARASSEASGLLKRMERERAMFEARADGYDGLRTSAAMRLFASRVEGIAMERDHLRDQSPAAVPPPLAEPSPSPPSPAADPFGSFDGSAMPAAVAAVAPPLPTPPARPDAPPASAPAPSAPETADVALYYPRTPLSRDWMQEFKPIFTSWVTELLGREPLILDSARAAALAGEPADHASLGAGAFPETGIRVAVAMLPLRFSRDAGQRAGFEALKKRFGDSLVLFSLEPDVQDDPQVREFHAVDFSDLAYIGEGFAKSERSLVFQDRVRSVAQAAVSLIGDSDPV